MSCGTPNKFIIGQDSISALVPLAHASLILIGWVISLPSLFIKASATLVGMINVLPRQGYLIAHAQLSTFHNDVDDLGDDFVQSVIFNSNNFNSLFS